MSLTVRELSGLPEATPDRDLVSDLARALSQHTVREGDVLCVAQKVVSKWEDRSFPLSGVDPSPLAERYAPEIGKDPRLVQAILDHSRRVIRMHEQVLITETPHGFICANAGLDQSNLDGEDRVLALPEDPDRSADRIRAGLAETLGTTVAVIITDTWGRPWRLGQVNVCIGLSGRRALRDHRGEPDDFGEELTETVIAEADELAGAAELVMEKSRRVPAVLISGLDDVEPEETGRALLRPPSEDLFR